LSPRCWPLTPLPDVEVTNYQFQKYLAVTANTPRSPLLAKARHSDAFSGLALARATTSSLDW
jgi:hypothetical protein